MRDVSEVGDKHSTTFITVVWLVLTNEGTLNNMIAS